MTDCRWIDEIGDCLNCGAHIAAPCRGAWPPYTIHPVLRRSMERTEVERQRYLNAPDRDQWREYLGVMWSPAEFAGLRLAPAGTRPKGGDPERGSMRSTSDAVTPKAAGAQPK